jgi:hypothetical protein
MRHSVLATNKKGLHCELTHKSWTVQLGYQKGLSSVLHRTQSL